MGTGRKALGWRREAGLKEKILLQSWLVVYVGHCGIHLGREDRCGQWLPGCQDLFGPSEEAL